VNVAESPEIFVKKVAESLKIFAEKLNEICSFYHEARNIYETGSYMISVDRISGIQTLQKKYSNKPAMSENRPIWNLNISSIEPSA
jgi:hypothetical protein